MATSDPRGETPLQENSLGTYLQSHVAGSHTAEHVAQRLLDDDAASEEEKAFLRPFIADIQEERSRIEALLDQIERDDGLLRRGLDAATGLAGIAGELASRASPGKFADLEALAIGVWGKRLLWGALLKLAEVDERFRSLPLVELSDQAERQEVELLRLRSDAIVPSLTAS